MNEKYLDLLQNNDILKIHLEQMIKQEETTSSLNKTLVANVEQLEEKVKDFDNLTLN